jgi:hypothetical protein
MVESFVYIVSKLVSRGKELMNSWSISLIYQLLNNYIVDWMLILLWSHFRIGKHIRVCTSEWPNRIVMLRVLEMQHSGIHRDFVR